MATAPNDPPVGGEKVKFRMTREDYFTFESKLTPPAVIDTTSPINAGFKLGVQHVLALLRKDYVQGL
jgi:hypothetical protein